MEPIIHPATERVVLEDVHRGIAAKDIAASRQIPLHDVRLVIAKHKQDIKDRASAELAAAAGRPPDPVELRIIGEGMIRHGADPRVVWANFGG